MFSSTKWTHVRCNNAVHNDWRCAWSRCDRGSAKFNSDLLIRGGREWSFNQTLFEWEWCNKHLYTSSLSWLTHISFSVTYIINECSIKWHNQAHPNYWARTWWLTILTASHMNRGMDFLILLCAAVHKFIV